jgi:hypothetical protein
LPDLAVPQALTRIWCIFEIASAMAGVVNKLHIITSGFSVFMPEWDVRDALTSVHDAQATVPSDIPMIMQMINDSIPNGAEGLDALLAQAITPLLTTYRLNFSHGQQLEALLAAGADPNGRTSDGSTPLQHACSACDFEVG